MQTLRIANADVGNADVAMQTLGIAKMLVFVSFLKLFGLIIKKCRRWEFRLCAELGQLAWGLGKPLFSFGFVTFSGAPPVIPLAVGGGRGRRQRRDADGGNRESICFIRF